MVSVMALHELFIVMFKLTMVSVNCDGIVRAFYNEELRMRILSITV